ncbi:hypothetical protein Lalb_Chr07g0183091 [Lupinus albus]|uniref:Uncharacterized protein n=1 Tax=Lupinus albus TaxID=3870 RepID=A0A6A4Q881_LUPAL|nr:hypothetical protein Lalb_Chr07g0183091 [Lupinus albus]
MKSILQLFEKCSGLKINFNKCNLLDVNIMEDHIIRCADFLQCKISSKSFTYLGIPVGVSHKRKSTWSNLIDKIQSRLAFWDSNQISFGGQVILTNVVLSALPVYYLSFYKAPISVVRSTQKIQSRFLWGGDSNSNKINWVKWEKVCQSKKEGGLGIKDLKIFNHALLDKWKWRLLKERDNLWCKVLVSKYGHSLGLSHEIVSRSSFAKHSSWVRDLDLVCHKELVKDHWFWGGLVRRVGDGSNTRFWHDTWPGSSNLTCRYRRLFSISVTPNDNICSFGSWTRDLWEWNFTWRRQLFS